MISCNEKLGITSGRYCGLSQEGYFLVSMACLVEGVTCNPKEYDGKGGAVVFTQWIEKMKSVQDMSGCSIDQKVKYTAGSFVEFCPSHEMQKLEIELWNHAMVRAGHAAYTGENDTQMCFELF
nr:hypothetical protein [Tanacetum cinerariifolium]